MLLLPSTCSSLINRYQIPVPERLSVQLVGERVCSKIRQRESIQTRQYRSSGMFYQYNGGLKAFTSLVVYPFSKLDTDIDETTLAETVVT